MNADMNVPRANALKVPRCQASSRDVTGHWVCPYRDINKYIYIHI